MLCRTIHCPEDLLLLDQQCLSENQYTNNNCYVIFLKLTPQENVSFDESATELEDFGYVILEMFDQYIYIMEGIQIYKKSVSVGEKQRAQNFLEYVMIKVMINPYNQRWPHYLRNFIKEYHDATHLLYYIMTITVNVEIISVIGTTHQTVTIIEDIDSINRSHVTLNSFFQYEPIPQIACNSSEDIHFNSLLLCPFVKVEIAELPISIDGELKVVQDNISKMALPQWKYKTDGGVLHICLDDYQLILENIVWMQSPVNSLTSQVIKPAQLLSLVCVCISIICSFVTILTYLCIPRLQTQPGVNNIILCVSLILAQTMYQFGSGQKSLSTQSCSIIGASCHFLWLCVIFSMNSCSIQMFSIFKHNIKLSSQFSWKTTSRIILYIIGSSCVFVCLNIVDSFVQSDGKESGYGGTLCFISTPVLHTITLILPLAVTVTINICLFVYVVSMIRKSTVSKKVLNHKRNYFAIYARLSTLTGLTWMVGYLYIFIEHEIIEYVFIILNASQGVFIMAGFILNERMCTQCKMQTKLKSDKTTISSTKTSEIVLAHQTS